MRLLACCLCFVSIYCSDLFAQRISFGEELGGESTFYAETKQVNQFFRRFNCEESPLGERYFPKDSLYRDPVFRLEYLQALFDLANPSMTPQLKNSFISSVTQAGRETYLDFHGGKWFAEIEAEFTFLGKVDTALLFMELEEAHIGSKWVFKHIHFPPLTHPTYKGPAQKDIYLGKVNGEDDKFLHPLSHELDFMNLNKVFRDRFNLQYYVSNTQPTDALKLFLYEVKRNRIRFEKVGKVTFHFFQVKDWYFELTNIQRSGKNRGYLISQLSEISEKFKPVLMDYIFRLK